MLDRMPVHYRTRIRTEYHTGSDSEKLARLGCLFFDYSSKPEAKRKPMWICNYRIRAGLKHLELQYETVWDTELPAKTPLYQSHLSYFVFKHIYNHTEYYIYLFFHTSFKCISCYESLLFFHAKHCKNKATIWSFERRSPPQLRSHILSDIRTARPDVHKDTGSVWGWKLAMQRAKSTTTDLSTTLKTSYQANYALTPSVLQYLILRRETLPQILSVSRLHGCNLHLTNYDLWPNSYNGSYKWPYLILVRNIAMVGERYSDYLFYLLSDFFHL